MTTSMEPGFYSRAETNDGGTVIFGRKLTNVEALACFDNWEKSHKALLKEMWIVIVSEDGTERRVSVKRWYRMEDA